MRSLGNRGAAAVCRPNAESVIGGNLSGVGVEFRALFPAAAREHPANASLMLRLGETWYLPCTSKQHVFS